MDTDRIAITELRPGDQFRLSHVLPVVTVERIGSSGSKNYDVRVDTQEEPFPLFARNNRQVWRVKGQAQV